MECPPNVTCTKRHLRRFAALTLFFFALSLGAEFTAGAQPPTADCTSTTTPPTTSDTSAVTQCGDPNIEDAGDAQSDRIARSDRKIQGNRTTQSDSNVQSQRGGSWVVITPAPTPVPSPVLVAKDSFRAQVERLVIQKTNNFRRRNGRAPLTIDSRYNDIARSWSYTMWSRRKNGDPNAYSHNPNYSKQMNAGNVWYGENVLMALRLDLSDANQVAETIVAGWGNSRSHSDNMLRREFRRLGVGVYIDSNGDVFATQDFSG